MAIPEKCPKCGSGLIQFSDGETWFCEQGTDYRDASRPKCRYQYNPTWADIIEHLKEEFPDEPPPPPGRPVFGVARPEDYTPTDWNKEIAPFKGRAL